jgi:uncharacterized protein
VAVTDLYAKQSAHDTTASHSGPQPGILGTPMFTLATLALGLATLGYIPPASHGGVLPIVLAATGLGQFVAAVWAMALGEAVHAALNGAFAAFWLSDAALGLGELHNWYGVQPSDRPHVQALFLLSWTIVFFLFFLASFRLPRTISTLLASVVITGVVLTIQTVSPSSTGNMLSGVGLLMVSAHGAYMLLNAMNLASGGRGLPQGPPIFGRHAGSDTAAVADAGKRNGTLGQDIPISTTLVCPACERTWVKAHG